MRIRALTLLTRDVAAQAAFWHDALGLATDAGGDALTIRLRESWIRFDPAPANVDARYHFAINIPRGRIEDAAEWIAVRHDVLAFHEDPEVDDGATIVRTDRGAAALYFLDGGGNVVELIANDRLENRSDAPFGPGLLIEIAEIGIATTDTRGTSRSVQEVLGAGVLWGGRPGWRLTAIGDDHGVVIVAPIGRGWIPTALPAVPLPTSIVADGPEAREVTLPEGPYRIRSCPPAGPDLPRRVSLLRAGRKHQVL